MCADSIQSDPHSLYSIAVVEADPLLRSDLRTLTLFIDLYCRYKHRSLNRRAVELGELDIDKIAGRSILLCPDCSKLLLHGIVKRMHCPRHPKPLCKQCPKQCLHPKYRAAIKDVMRFSGRIMILSGRLDYLVHLLY
jgi:hypothetical protein